MKLEKKQSRRFYFGGHVLIAIVILLFAVLPLVVLSQYEIYDQYETDEEIPAGQEILWDNYDAGYEQTYINEQASSNNYYNTADGNYLNRFEPMTSAGSKFCGGVFSSLLSGDVVKCVTLWVGNIFITIAGWALTLFAKFLNFTIKASVLNFTNLVSGVSGIQVAWTVIRDLANILFIFILLWLSIKTIVGLDDARKYLGSIIVAALLVNFSLFFTRLIIDAGNIVAVQFYSGIVGEQGGLAEKFLEGIDPQTIFKGKSVSNLTYIQILLTIVSGFIVLVITAFVFLGASILFLSRFVILLFLMATAPIGFVGHLLEQTKGYADSWWKTLSNQVLVAPVFLGLLWIALIFVSSLQHIGRAVTGTQSSIVISAKEENKNRTKLSNLAAVGVYEISVNTTDPNTKYLASEGEINYGIPDPNTYGTYTTSGHRIDTGDTGSDSRSDLSKLTVPDSDAAANMLFSFLLVIGSIIFAYKAAKKFSGEWGNAVGGTFSKGIGMLVGGAGGFALRQSIGRGANSLLKTMERSDKFKDFSARNPWLGKIAYGTTSGAARASYDLRAAANTPFVGKPLSTLVGMAGVGTDLGAAAGAGGFKQAVDKKVREERAYMKKLLGGEMEVPDIDPQTGKQRVDAQGRKLTKKVRREEVYVESKKKTEAAAVGAAVGAAAGIATAGLGAPIAASALSAAGGGILAGMLQRKFPGQVTEELAQAIEKEKQSQEKKREREEKILNLNIEKEKLINVRNQLRDKIKSLLESGPLGLRSEKEKELEDVNKKIAEKEAEIARIKNEIEEERYKAREAERKNREGSENKKSGGEKEK